MPFPEDPRGLIVGMAFGHTQYEDPSGLTYEQLSPDPIDINDPGPVLGVVRTDRGRIENAPETAPTKITYGLRNNNDEERGEFSSRNVTGSRYGTLRPSTPARVSVDVGDGAITMATAFALGFEPTTEGPDIDPRVPITALGMLNRIGRDQEVRSVLSLTVGIWVRSGNARNWWPLEGGTAASPDLASGLTGELPLEAIGTVAGAASPPPGSAGAVDVSGGGALRGKLVADAASTLWCFQLGVRVSGAVVGSAYVADLLVGSLVYARIRISDSVGAELAVDFNDGSTTNTRTGAAPLLDDGEWHWINLSLETSAGITLVDVYADDVHVINVVNAGFNFLRPDSVMANPEADLAAVCHVVHFLDVRPTFLDESMTGLPGEEAATRAGRVLDGVGIANNIGTGGAVLGVQAAASLATILRDAEDAEDGVLYELRDGRVAFALNEDRQNQAVAWALDYEDITDLIMADDDRDQYNVITVSDPEGRIGVAEETDGDLGSSTATGIGPRPYSATRNLYNAEDLRHHAGWLLRKGTINKPRYVVVLDLHANPDLIPGYMDVATGSADILGTRITIDGAPEEDHGPDLIDLIVEGEVAEYGADRWLVQFYCEPYQPFEVGLLAAETTPDLNVHLGRFAAERLCAIRAAIDNDDTAIAIDPISRWTVTSADVNTGNYEALYAAIAGERMQVTAIAATASTYVAAGTPDHDDNAAVTPAAYAGGGAGDWVFVAARTRTTGAILAITDAGYTYTLLAKVGGLYLWAALRTGTTPAPTVTPSGGAAGNSVSAVTFGFTNMPSTLADLAEAVYVSSSKTNATSQNILTPGIRKGVRVGRLVLLIAGKSDDWTSVAPPTGFTEAVDTSTTSGNDQGLYVAYRIDTSPTWVSPNALAVTGGATAVSEAMVVGLASGYETLTVVRSANSVVKSHSTGAPVEVVDPLIWAL